METFLSTILDIKENPSRSQKKKWSENLCVKNDDWGKIYSMAFQATKH